MKLLTKGLNYRMHFFKFASFDRLNFQMFCLPALLHPLVLAGRWKPHSLKDWKLSLLISWCVKISYTIKGSWGRVGVKSECGKNWQTRKLSPPIFDFPLSCLSSPGSPVMVLLFSRKQSCTRFSATLVEKC